MSVTRFRRIVAALQAALLLTCGSIWSEDAAARAAQAGTLSTIKGQQVVHLFGENVKERGYAQGYLLAEKIRSDFDAAMVSLPMFSPQKFESGLLPWAKNFDWDADSVQELDGVYEGMRARLGDEGMKSPALGRAYTRADIAAVNVIGDYFGPACSAFTVWSSRTGGEVIHGRNLDFPIGARPVADQVLYVSEPLAKHETGPARLSWVALGWPGLIVQFSAMNSSGVVVCLHDGYNVNRGEKGGVYTPRGLLLRRIIESVDADRDEPAAAAAKLVAATHAACGNLFHMSWPGEAARKFKETPSAVLEFDPADSTPKIRRMDDSGALVVTNHFRTLTAPVACERYTNMTNGLEAYKNAGKKIGIAEARRILISAEQPVAAHSIYFFPDTLEFQFAETKDNVMSPHVPPTAFSFKELFEPHAEHALK